MEKFEAKHNVQIYPTRQRIVPNDRLSKVIFNLTDDDYLLALERQEPLDLVEMKNHKKFGEILSPFKISLDGDNEFFYITEPLNQFDCAVLSVGISEYSFGNTFTTPSIIYRNLTGKVGRSDAEPQKDQLAAIFQSVNKLMRIQLFYNSSELCSKLHYKPSCAKEFVSTLMPCRYLKSSTINGKDTTLIELLAPSPLFEIAKMKNEQLLTYDATLFNIPNQNNTPLAIAVKFYVMNRIQEIKLHKMTPTITFADVFQKCRVVNSGNKAKLDLRNLIIKFFEHLRKNNEIKNFKVTKKKNTFHSITFSYTKIPRKLIARRYD